MKGYKGYEKGLICRGKQYAVGEVFEEDIAEICKSGMHFCALPHQVFEHYSAGENHEFTEVEALDETYTDDERKYCTKKLKIGAKINVFDICKISVQAFFELFDFKTKITRADTNNAGDCGAANAGNCGAAIVRRAGTASVGANGVAIGLGNDAKACGKKNAILVLVRFGKDGNITAYKAIKIDGKRYKADVYYTLGEYGKVKVAE